LHRPWPISESDLCAEAVDANNAEAVITDAAKIALFIKTLLFENSFLVNFMTF
jgi:hypothetical protein